jgi:drug/metabolite transporter (DMT)-like permease
VGRTVLPTAGLLGATGIWGSTFVVTKGSLEAMPPASLLAWRFGVAAAALLLLRPRALADLEAAQRGHAVTLGGALSAGFLLQTTGLLHVPAAESGFLTGSAVVLTPVVAAALFRERVGPAGWAAVALSAAGMAALAGPTGAAPTRASAGAALTIAGAGCFAVHIAGLSRWSTRENAYSLTACSVAVAAVACSAVALLGSGLNPPRTAPGWGAVVYLGLMATCVGFAVQAWAQSAISATAAAVTMTMEPVFAAVIATASGERALGPSQWLGGCLVVGGMSLAEVGARRCCDALTPRVGCC